MTREYKRHNIKREDIEELYWGQDMSMGMVGERLNIAPGYINYLMDKLGIPKRSKSDALKLGIKQGRVATQLYEKNTNWKGGRIIIRGYIQILKPEHHRASKAGYVFEHILVWEQTNGRPLPEGWIVHHLNGIRHDNRPENLLGMPRKSHHYALLLQGLRKRVRQLEAEITNLRTQGRFELETTQ